MIHLSHMKRFFIAFFALALIGAGCAAGEVSQERTDVNWWLSFDLPEDWVMVAHYGGGALERPSAEGIAVRSTDIVLQTTDLPILLEGDEPSENWTEYVQEDYTYIRVFRYSSARPLPDDAQDLGNGYYSADWYGQTAYWHPAEFGNYLFTVELNGESQTIEAAETIIFGAQENDLTDQL